MANRRSQFWCFTDHDTSIPMAEALEKRYRFTTREGNEVKPSYLVLGDELASTTQKRHFQGYIEYDRVVSLKQLTDNCPGPHYEARAGTAVQAANYCKKEGQFLELGSISNPGKKGKRTDIEDIHARALAGARMGEIVTMTTSFQVMRMAEKVREYSDVRRNWKPHVSWFWGPTGTGKTRTAVEEAGGWSNQSLWKSSGSLRWWFAYDGHEDVILDDFRGSFCAMHTLLEILDRNPFYVEVKGGQRSLVARRIWITSPYAPVDTYKSEDGSRHEAMDQLLRRIDVIRYFGEQGTFFADDGPCVGVTPPPEKNDQQPTETDPEPTV